MEEEMNLYDDFMDDRSAGNVVRTLSTSGHKRLGVDVEGVLSIDNGALRIAPLIEAGFGRAVISYGPFSRIPGLAFAVFILNGHNTAQAEQLKDTFIQRIARWLQGSETDPRLSRLVRWVQSGRVRRTLRQFRWWKRTAKDSNPVPLLDENLAVGWFPTAIVQDPRYEGNAFVMHALGPENGELWAGGNRTRTRSLRGVQNLPLYLISILRGEGAIYYISSVDGVPGIATYPQLRPLVVEYCNFPDEIYLGIQQGVLGQIGFRLDTRIRQVRVANVDGYESWHGGAHAADRLIGDGILGESDADVGGKWKGVSGEAQRGPVGATGSNTNTMAILDSETATGLIHAIATLGNGELNHVGIIWRFLDEYNHWRLEVNARNCAIVLVSGGTRQVLAAKNLPYSCGKKTFRLQVLDDGKQLMAYVDGEPVVESNVKDTRMEAATGVGILLGLEKGVISSFEAHPRSIEMPKALLMESPWSRKGTNIVVADDFAGQPGDLEGRSTPIGSRRWSRVIGSGVIETTGEGASRIRGSVEEPCPGRTVYCVDWPHSDFADLEATITPPGSERGQKHQSIAGFIIYQDKDNYVTLNVWRGDSYGGASISTFFKFNGFEDLYDAIWTNIGNRASYGCPTQIRLCCDGEQYMVFVNDEPVLYRAFRDVYSNTRKILIRKVGLIANWEWGRDTGSRFERFISRV